MEDVTNHINNLGKPAEVREITLKFFVGELRNLRDLMEAASKVPELIGYGPTITDTWRDLTGIIDREDNR